MTQTMNELQETFLLALKDRLPSARIFSDNQLVKKIGPEKLLEALEQIVNYIEPACGNVELQRNEYFALISQVLNHLIQYLKQINVPITLTTVMSNIHLVEHTTDLAFPGYANAGFLRSIISNGGGIQRRKMLAMVG